MVGTRSLRLVIPSALLVFGRAPIAIAPGEQQRGVDLELTK